MTEREGERHTEREPERGLERGETMIKRDTEREREKERDRGGESMRERERERERENQDQYSARVLLIAAKPSTSQCSFTEPDALGVFRWEIKQCRKK